jgi:hypothetical protein
MKNPASVLLDGARSGIYSAPAASAGLEQSARENGFAWFELDLSGVAAKTALLVRCQTVFALPSAFGHNWDALADSLEDLSWHPARGYLVLVTNGGEVALNSPQDLAAALEIFAAAARYWMTKGRLFMVLLDAQTRGGRTLKSLSLE